MTDLNLQQIDLEDLLAWYQLDYKCTTGSSGPQLNIKECPRCGSTEWKVYFNADTNIGNCFSGSCTQYDKGFNIFSFFEHLTHSKKEAFNVIERYNRELGWRPPRKRRVVRISPDFIMPQSTAITDEMEPGLRYCMRRGFSSDTAQYYHWRYSQEGVFTYKQQDGSEGQQWYKNRLLIPIFDLQGRLATFQGRDMTDVNARRYLFPPGLAGSGRYLYDAHNAVGKEAALLCEGVFDVAAASQALSVSPSMEEVAIMGTFGISLSGSLTEADESQIGQLIELKDKGLKEVTMMWDGSFQAVNAAINTCQKLNALGLNTYIAILPLDSDPNEVDPVDVRRSYTARIQATMGNLLKLKAMLR